MSSNPCDHFTSDIAETASIEIEVVDGNVEVTIARGEPDGILADDTLVITFAEARELAQGLVAVLR